MDGYLESCLKNKCAYSCCSRGYGEPVYEFESSERINILDELIAAGISIQKRGGMVWYSGCSDGIDCKMLKYFCDDSDIRSLVCKIFPYKKVGVTGGGITKDTVGIFLANCPATAPDFSVDERFTSEVISLIKDHYQKYYAKDVDVILIDGVPEC